MFASPAPPGTDPESWSGEVFKRVSSPADWCTIRQAQERQNKAIRPDNLLEQIADGSVVSQVYTPEEAIRLLGVLNRNAKKEL